MTGNSNFGSDDKSKDTMSGDKSQQSNLKQDKETSTISGSGSKQSSDKSNQSSKDKETIGTQSNVSETSKQ